MMLLNHNHETHPLYSVGFLAGCWPSSGIITYSSDVLRLYRVFIGLFTYGLSRLLGGIWFGCSLGIYNLVGVEIGLKLML